MGYNPKIADLIIKLEQGKLKQEELIELTSWYNRFDDKLLELPITFATNEEEINHRIEKEIIKRIHADKNAQKLIKLKKWSLTIAAISIGLAFLNITIVYFFTNYFSNKDQKETDLSNINVSPGGNKAILILENGKKIDLNIASNGIIIADNKINIIKKKDGEIIYSETGSAESKVIRYNVLETPKGGQYHLVLPDGSNVWLNSATRLRFPKRFLENERKVYLEGEAFFDIKHDNKRNFKVSAGNQQISVLGTAFNINAYADESKLKFTFHERENKKILTVFH